MVKPTFRIKRYFCAQVESATSQSTKADNIVPSCVSSDYFAFLLLSKLPRVIMNPYPDVRTLDMNCNSILANLSSFFFRHQKQLPPLVTVRTYFVVTIFRNEPDQLSNTSAPKPKQRKERNLLHDLINAKEITYPTSTKLNLPLLKCVFNLEWVVLNTKDSRVMSTLSHKATFCVSLDLFLV